MIVAEGVSKKFTKKISRREYKEFYADDNISFEAHNGEVLGILGPNGAGKTTLLRMLSGIMTPTSGIIHIDGMTYNDNEIKIKKKLAFLSGNTRLYKDLSGIELLRLCGEYYDISHDLLEERIKKAVQRFEMENFIHQRIETLSTGQYQRVSIARCIIHDPDYYIFDEATSGLDVLSGKVILDFIKEEKSRGKCIIYSTHYMEEAYNICDRILMLCDGQVIADDTSDAILEYTNTTNLREAFFALKDRGGLK